MTNPSNESDQALRNFNALTQQDPDLVDRIFDYLLAECPQIAGPKFAQMKTAVRKEFGGGEVYIPVRGATARQQTVIEVLSLFNGRNAREVARRLNIGRTTVYRIIKQAGQGEKSPSFPRSGTEQ